MPQFNETELTAAVIRSFDDTPIRAPNSCCRNW